MLTFKRLMIILVVAGFLLTACGARAQTVNITLTDYAIESSQTSFEVGVPYHFVVTNEGVLNHELMIMPPMTEEQMSMNMDMEEMDAMALAMIEEDELDPGTTKTLDYTFTDPAPAGSLEFACHSPDHYEKGMKLPITVK
jgi:uncharacterized cupredoxin-like copper-binding protein